MSENNPYRTVIAPVSTEGARPLWSVMIPTYNCAAYLREALCSVLDQDPGPELMQIEVVDDCSTQDDPQAIVAEVGRGRVNFYRQPQNVGHCRNFDTCVQRSRGRLIHLLHGDDGVRDGFYQKLERAFAQQEIGAAFCRYISMDEAGHWQTISPLEQSESGVIPNWLEKIATGQRTQPPAMVVRREVYERLGGFDNRISRYGEDWEMWVRIAAAQYPVWFETEPLALYRIHKSSLTGNSLRSGENARDLRRVIEIIRSYLPETHAKAWTNRARSNFAAACLRRARRLLDTGEYAASWAQTREALRTSISASIMAQAVLLLTRSVWRMFIAR